MSSRIISSPKFTLIEVMAALVICILGMVAVTSLTSIGLELGHKGIAQSVTYDAAAQFLRFNHQSAKEQWEWLDAFPNSKIPHDDSVIADDTELSWSQSSLFETGNIRIRFLTDDVHADFNSERQRTFTEEEKSKRSVFLYEQLSNAYPNYKVSLRVWKDKVVLNDGAETALLYVEASFPAERPYISRHKETLSLWLFKSGKTSIEPLHHTP